MAFAPFPAATYLADGARTEGEMKTAFENWLLATKQTGGHGECQLQYVSPTQIRLVPQNGRRVLCGVNADTLLVPTTGVYLTNAGLLANSSHLIAMLPDGNMAFIPIGGTVFTGSNPESGITQIGEDGVLNPALTLVGAVATTPTGTFAPETTCSWFTRRLLATRTHPVNVTLTSTSEVPLLIHYALVWGDEALTFDVQCYLANASGSAQSVNLLIYIGGAPIFFTTVTVPPSSNFPASLRCAYTGGGSLAGVACELRGYLGGAGTVTLTGPMLTVTRMA